MTARTSHAFEETSNDVSSSILDRTLKAYRIGIHNNRYPIFDGTGAKLYPGRWNQNYPVIYCGSNYSLALLEKLVHSNTGDIPEHQQWIEITIPVGTTYETVTTYSLPNWKQSSVSKTFGDNWLDSKRSCILIVPSAIAPVENNILINESHPQFSTITTSLKQDLLLARKPRRASLLNQPVIWDRRLFFPTD